MHTYTNLFDYEIKYIITTDLQKLVLLFVR